MAVKQMKAPVDIPSSELEDWGPVPEPIGEPVSHLRGLTLNENADGSEAGLWECTPGQWVRKVMDAEISSFLSGHALFHHEGGETIEIKAGDSVYFDNNSKGIWEVLETTRKIYLTYKREA
ncbi:MAG: cupin domain-containing protein [Pseudomonadota bacterium]